MPRPNIMWLWSAITLVIIGYWIFSNEEFAPVKSDWATVEQMVEAGDVEKIVVVNRDEARVELKEGRAEASSFYNQIIICCTHCCSEQPLKAVIIIKPYRFKKFP